MNDKRLVSFLFALNYLDGYIIWSVELSGMILLSRLPYYQEISQIRSKSIIFVQRMSLSLLPLWIVDGWSI